MTRTPFTICRDGASDVDDLDVVAEQLDRDTWYGPRHTYVLCAILTANIVAGVAFGALGTVAVIGVWLCYRLVICETVVRNKLITTYTVKPSKVTAAVRLDPGHHVRRLAARSSATLIAATGAGVWILLTFIPDEYAVTLMAGLWGSSVYEGFVARKRRQALYQKVIDDATVSQVWAASWAEGWQRRRREARTALKLGTTGQTGGLDTTRV